MYIFVFLFFVFRFLMFNFVCDFKNIICFWIFKFNNFLKTESPAIKITEDNSQPLEEDDMKMLNDVLKNSGKFRGFLT